MHTSYFIVSGEQNRGLGGAKCLTAYSTVHSTANFSFD